MNNLKHHAGFTLIELAVVMSIVALLIGGMLMPLTTRFNEQAYADTKTKLDKVNEALTGFAILNRRLPCPGDANGAELPSVVSGGNFVCGVTTVSDSSFADTNTSWGIVPWQALGLNETDVLDSWSYRLRYSVRTQLTLLNSLNQTNLSPGSPSVSASPNGIKVRTANAGGTDLTTTALYLLHSTGKNGAGGNLSGTNPASNTSYKTIPISADELANLPREESSLTAAIRGTFVSRIRTDAEGSLGEFDDVVIWMSPTTLTAKLAAAGVWTP